MLSGGYMEHNEIEVSHREYMESLEEARIDERKRIAHIARLLESWGQLNVKDFPLITAFVQKLEQGEPVYNRE